MTSMRRLLELLAPKREHRIALLLAAIIGMAIGLSLVLSKPVVEFYNLSCSFWDHPFLFGCHGSEVAGLRRFISGVLWGSFDAAIAAGLVIIIRLTRV